MISPKVRAQHAAYAAKTAGWRAYTIHTTSFTLKAYGSRRQGKTLIIYIEGDGLAWVSADRPSDNPTPITPTGLKMALHHHKNISVAYIARPCQFVFNKQWVGCQSAYWTNLRFSDEVIRSMNQAVGYLKKYYHAEKIILIGYSGGGTIAALISARRADVVRLITIAAPLDVKQWVNLQKLSPLNGSLDPADEWKYLVSIPQTHWIGGKDTIVPKEVLISFVNHFPPLKKPEIKEMPSYDHICCWAEEWAPNILISGVSSFSK